MIIILTIISTSTITIIVITNIVITIVTSSITIFIIFLIGISTSTLIQFHIIRNALYYMQTYITHFTAFFTQEHITIYACAEGREIRNSEPSDLESDALPLRHTPLLCDVFGHTVLNVLLLLLVLLLVLLLHYYYSYYY